ncbi:MAG: hypothetical protein ACKOYP_06685, partial [Bacteroidota bacterium]
YLKFKSFLTPGYNLLVEGTVAKKSWGDMPAEFRIRSMELLNEIGAKRAKGIQLTVDPAVLKPEFINEIEKICKANSGTTPLYLRLRDAETQVTVELLSRKYRIRPGEDSIKLFRKLDQVEITVM